MNFIFPGDVEHIEFKRGRDKRKRKKRLIVGGSIATTGALLGGAAYLSKKTNRDIRKIGSGKSAGPLTEQQKKDALEAQERFNNLDKNQKQQNRQLSKRFSSWFPIKKKKRSK